MTRPRPGSTFECSLDGAAWEDCVSAASYAGLVEGSHTFETRATDAAGNTDLSPAARTFTVELPVVPDPVEPTPDPVDPAPDPVDRPTTLPDPVEDLDSLKHYRVAEREIVSGRAYRRSGSKRRLYVDDGDRLEIAAEQKRADVFVSEFQASMAIGTDVRDSLGSLTLSYNGGTSARTGSVTVYAFNYRTDRWVKAFAHTGRPDRSLEWSASAFALDYVSQEGTFSVRVKGKRAKAFRTRTDLLELTVES